MLTIVCHYRDPADPPVTRAHYAPSQAWIDAYKTKQAHPGDRVTVVRPSAEQDAENTP